MKQAALHQCSACSNPGATERAFRTQEPRIVFGSMMAAAAVAATAATEIRLGGNAAQFESLADVLMD